MDEVAARLRISKRSLQRALKKYPYYHQFGRRMIFTEDDYQKILAATQFPLPPRNARARRTSTSAAPSEAKLYARARELVTATQQRRGKKHRPVKGKASDR